MMKWRQVEDENTVRAVFKPRQAYCPLYTEGIPRGNKMKSIVVLLWQVGLIFMIRAELCEDIVIITHKRVFRHKPKRKIPVLRRFLLLNYIHIFKRKWMWHYICFVLEIPFSILTVIASVLSEIWAENKGIEIMLSGMLMISMLLVGVPCLSVALKRGTNAKSTRRKK